MKKRMIIVMALIMGTLSGLILPSANGILIFNK